jgi:hypothetical protein
VGPTHTLLNQLERYSYSTHILLKLLMSSMSSMSSIHVIDIYNRLA